MKKTDTLYILMPCYNEEKVIENSVYELTSVLKQLITKKKISKKSRLFIIDDGSSDNTVAIIRSLMTDNNYVSGLVLSRNYGQQNALMCGLKHISDKADMVITIDADLQDDISVIEEMILKYYDGIDVVYGVRKSRKKDSFFKRNTAQFFYRFMTKMGVEIVYNHAEFRLLSKRVINELDGFEERNLFLRGIIPLIGFSSDKVYYERKKRMGGTSKYSLKKMINLALDGITSFSIKPIRLIFNLGLIMLVLSFVVIITSL